MCSCIIKDKVKFQDLINGGGNELFTGLGVNLLITKGDLTGDLTGHL